MFADDVQIYSISESPEKELSKFRICLENITKWATTNYLKLNEDKSKFMIVSNSSATTDILQFNDVDSKLEKVVKNLGFPIDRTLNFNAQINQVCRKGFNLLRNLWKISSKLNNIDLKTRLITSCLFPHIDYCNSLYACLPNKYIHKLQRLMNAAVRFIFNFRRFERISISEHLKKLHFLPVKYRVDFKVCSLVYKIMIGAAPEYLANLIRPKTSLPSLRVYNDQFLLEVPKPEKENYKNRCFSLYAPKLWNSLPKEIRSACSLLEFQSKLKTHYFSIAYSS